MAYIPSKPILADDPLAYFSALKVQKSRSAPSLPMTPAVRAIDLMYGYYSVE